MYAAQAEGAKADVRAAGDGAADGDAAAADDVVDAEFEEVNDDKK
jgi:hypothetical protein